MPVVEVVFGKGRAPRWSVPGALEALAFSTLLPPLPVSLGEGAWAVMAGRFSALGTHTVGWDTGPSLRIEGRWPACGDGVLGLHDFCPAALLSRVSFPLSLI